MAKIVKAIIKAIHAVRENENTKAKICNIRPKEIRIVNSLVLGFIKL
ncbi:unnamed protein product [marine sediment metagenome]|uniref:Uncharacterized protein n=1 Tax=marine sediment metagenome TaxID=412755 RepID=X1E1A1_9ZZZZ